MTWLGEKALSSHRGNAVITALSSHLSCCSICRMVYVARTVPLSSSGHCSRLRFIKINCVDFKEVCAAQKVRGFPEVRFYTRDGNYRSYKGARDLASIKAFAATQATTGQRITEGAVLRTTLCSFCTLVVT